MNDKKNSESTVNLIENLSKYVVFLISDIIHYLNPMENHDVKIQKNNMNLRESLTFCHEILKSLISCNKIKMEKINSELFIDEALEDVLIFTDEQRFKQILLNLLSNSVKFTNIGEIKISAEIYKEKSMIIVSVSDTGIGIKDENKNKLFKDYSQISDGNSIDKLGDGLGLSICKYLGKKLDIKIQYTSEYGKGTRFDLIFYKKFNEKKEKILNMTYNNEDIFINPRSLYGNQKSNEKSSKFKYANSSIHSPSFSSIDYLKFNLTNENINKLQYLSISNENISGLTEVF
jgi:K+-sensing histidine kinase KdpD